MVQTSCNNTKVMSTQRLQLQDKLNIVMQK